MGCGRVSFICRKIGGSPLRDEFALIHLLTQYRPSPPPSVEVDVGDDAAVVHPLNRSLVITSDTMIETVHFLPETMNPADIGWKLAAANISDIAAMGGLPRYGVVSLSVPRHWEMNALVDLYRGCMIWQIGLVW